MKDVIERDKRKLTGEKSPSEKEERKKYLQSRWNKAKGRKKSEDDKAKDLMLKLPEGRDPEDPFQTKNKKKRAKWKDA